MVKYHFDTLKSSLSFMWKVWYNLTVAESLDEGTYIKVV